MKCSTHCVVDWLVDQNDDDDDEDDGYNNHDDYIQSFHDLGDDYNHECLILNTIALITLMKQRWSENLFSFIFIEKADDVVGL